MKSFLKMYFGKYLFYTNFILLFLKNEFKELYNNILIILKSSDIKIIILFLILIPISYYTIKIQIFFCILFIIYYLFLFVFYRFVLQSNYVIKCEEIPLNINLVHNYAFFNIFVFIPKAKAFLIVYSFLDIIINNKMKKSEKFIFLLFLLLISFLIKLSILLIIGYTFLSLLVSSDLAITFFETISWKYETKKARKQHIIINCFINSKDTVGNADNKKIIIEGDIVILNSLKFIRDFLSKVKGVDKFEKAFEPEAKNTIFTKYVNNHYTWTLKSSKYKEKNVSGNVTSKSWINVKKEDGTFEKFECSAESSQRIDGKNQSQFFTRPYNLDENSVIKEINDNTAMKMQSLAEKFCNCVVIDGDKKIIESKNGEFSIKDDSPTVLHHTHEYKIPISEKIEALAEFEKINEDFLSSDEGKQSYNVVKKLITSDSFSKKFNSFKKDDENNSPYEDFIN